MQPVDIFDILLPNIETHEEEQKLLEANPEEFISLI